jgi:hypothetical protein
MGIVGPRHSKRLENGEACMAHEMVRQGLAIQKEVAIPVCDVSCAKPPASHFRGFRGFRGEML